MLILTKYKQAIIKVLFGLTNCLFFVWLKKIFSSKSKKILLYFIAIFGIILLLISFIIRLGMKKMILKDKEFTS